MITSEPWGSADGRPVELYTLSAAAPAAPGITVRIATFGGTVHSVSVPDRFGGTRNVALGFPSLEGYVSNLEAPTESGPAYFGAIVGRYANRIASRSFELDGERFELPGNNGPDDSVTMHGGPGAYSAEVWQAAPFSVGSDDASLRLTLVDPAGHNGFPGTVRNEVVYSVTADHALRIDYRASTDAPTIVNLTNHTYFNLAGEGSGDVHDQLLAVNAAVFQAVDSSQVPREFAAVAGTPFDFRVMKPIGRDIGGLEMPRGEQLGIADGYDQNWVLGGGAGYRLAAVAFDPGSGIVLWTYTDQPGIQVYTGNFLAGELIGTGGAAYRQRDGFALETQHFPDSPHHIGDPAWPSVVLRPGEELRTRTTYRFGVAGPELAERIRF
ncbi:MAG TPA: aldose epimerase family protein [Solirubrobacteraceae bacterium]|nr:aldose epimerase family protein [Solirubrobacteraceae bacterium]